MGEEVPEQSTQRQHDQYLPVHGQRESAFYHKSAFIPLFNQKKKCLALQVDEDNQKITPEKMF
jgi:hypothetical protein